MIDAGSDATIRDALEAFEKGAKTFHVGAGGLWQSHSDVVIPLLEKMEHFHHRSGPDGNAHADDERPNKPVWLGS